MPAIQWSVLSQGGQVSKRPNIGIIAYKWPDASFHATGEKTVEVVMQRRCECLSPEVFQHEGKQKPGRLR